MEYALYGISYVICGYATFRVWAYFDPPIKRIQLRLCDECTQQTSVSVINNDKEWVIDGDSLLTVVITCFVLWPIVLLWGSCKLAACSAIPKTKLKRSSEDSQDLLEEDFTALERKKHAHTP